MANDGHFESFIMLESHFNDKIIACLEQIGCPVKKKEKVNAQNRLFQALRLRGHVSPRLEWIWLVPCLDPQAEISVHTSVLKHSIRSNIQGVENDCQHL